MRMHIGFSFKPKFLLIVLAVILGIVGFCVDAFAADEIPEWALRPALEPGEDADRGYTTVYDMDGSILYTDDPALSVTANDTETPSNTVVINAAPAAEAAAPETYTYQRGEPKHTGKVFPGSGLLFYPVYRAGSEASAAQKRAAGYPAGT